MTTIASQLEHAKAQLTHVGAPFELVELEHHGLSYRAFKNAPTNLKKLVEPSRQLGDKTFLVYEGERWSFDTFFQQVDALGHQLVEDFSIAKGDRVAIAMRNYPEWMTAFIAIVSVGAVAVPLNSWGKAEELSYGVQNAGAKLVFCDQQRLDLMTPALTQQGVHAILVRPNEKVPSANIAPSNNVTRYDDVIEAGKGKTLPEVDLLPDDPALILYTSGTTGHPKGAVSNHRNIGQGIFNFNFAAANAAMTSPDTIQNIMASGYEPAALLCLPLFHVSGCHSVFLFNLHTGRKIVMMHKWDSEKALQLIAEERVTSLNGVPTMTRQLLESPKFSETDTSSLFSLGGGGAASPPQLMDLIYEKKPSAFAGTGYGLTETNATGASSTGEAYRYKPSSAGTLSPIVELQIRNEQGESLTAGETGEVWLKGIALLQGYWNNPQSTAESLQDAWFNTGDIGYLDEEGFLFLVDRAKDMIIRGGENIYAAEIEATVLRCPGVEEVAAFGVPDDTLGEELAVVVFAKSDAALSEEAIRAHVAEYLAKFKVPTYVSFSKAEPPKSATGKLLKKNLRREFIEKLSCSS